MSPKASPSRSTGLIDRLAVSQGRLPFVIALCLLSVLGVGTYMFTGGQEHGLILAFATVVGGYMALNIGANDVANNVSPAVGAKALTMGGALVIAAICELLGAIVAGGDVVSTISKGIIDVSSLQHGGAFLLLMLSALLAGAIWVNVATWVGAPVSTTHAIVGAVMGGGIAAAGVDVVNWDTMSKIAASWVVSPLLGGSIAAFFYFLLGILVFDQKDRRLEAAKKWVPLLISIMISVFTVYLLTKGLKKVYSFSGTHQLLIGAVLMAILPPLLRKPITKQAARLTNRKREINKLFSIPLIVSAALLSFAHGANDVANAVGPLAAIVWLVDHGLAVEGATKVGIPLWVMVIGSLGISFGLLLFGTKMITMVGQTITKLDHSRSYCVVLSAAITVIIASTLGLPVSSTHIAVGSIFGVGLFREFQDHRRRRKKNKEKAMAAVVGNKGPKRRKLVRRRALLTIITAWIVTVPCASFLSGMIFLTLSHFVQF